MNSLVSIVTTLYNYRRFVGELAESVLKQTYQDWEWIIVDDASTDRPYDILRKYCESTSLTYGRNVIYIQLEKNGGYSRAKNIGIRNSRGSYIVMIDADDMLTEDSLRARKKALDSNPEKLWCHGECLVTHNGELSEESRIWKRQFRKKLISDGMDLMKEYHHRLIHAQSVMVRPQLHKKYGLYDESLRFSSDNEMWRRVIRFGEIPVHIEDYVAIYRVHPNRMARSKYKKERIVAVKKKIIDDVERRFKEGINSENTILWPDREL